MNYNEMKKSIIVIITLLLFMNSTFSQSSEETNILSRNPDSYNKDSVPKGNWYGDNTYFGYEYDMHANMNDKDLGAGIDVEQMVELFRLSKCDLLQTDTKGHEGLVSWNSKTPAASIAPGFKKEMVDIWVKAGKKLDIPCQAHYSGIFDMAAGDKFPSWNAVNEKGEPVEGKMCPRSPYVDKLLIPQAKELIGQYGVSGLWVDGEIWAVAPCYCDKCKAEFKRRTSMDAPISKE
ncbi:MAG: hypothetical protein GY797_05440, partial [Deltaproteobacteria bacterium]|nr:hypothetical protein [Deltaproteobacteria bacterium]